MKKIEEDSKSENVENVPIEKQRIISDEEIKEALNGLSAELRKINLEAANMKQAVSSQVDFLQMKINTILNRINLNEYLRKDDC